MDDADPFTRAVEQQVGRGAADVVGMGKANAPPGCDQRLGDDPPGFADARAECLQGALQAQLAGLASLLDDGSGFDPSALTGAVNVLKLLGTEAPRHDITIHNRPWNVYEGLESNSFDLALGVFNDAPATTRVRALLHDFVCLARRGHPAVRKRLSLQRCVATPHVVIGIGQPCPTVIDRALAKRKLTRRVARRIPSFLARPASGQASPALAPQFAGRGGVGTLRPGARASCTPAPS